MARYAMAIDLDRCVGCQACAVACRAENEVPDGLLRLTVQEQAGEGPKAIVTFAHAQCFHCERPAYIGLCPTNATYKDANGVVRLDQDKCINCGYCVSACPYKARHFAADADAVQKCDFCAHRLDEGKLPACVEGCPTQARLFGDLDQTDSAFTRLVSSSVAKVFHPEYDMRPKLFYVDRGGKATDLAFQPLPTQPRVAPVAEFWNKSTRPLSGLGTGLAAAVTLLAFPAAWRNARMHEKALPVAEKPVEPEKPAATGEPVAEKKVSEPAKPVAEAEPAAGQRSVEPTKTVATAEPTATQKPAQPAK